MADKDFKTIDEQIEILRSRGLTIEDEAEAKDFLLRNNYYRVSGYSLTLRKNDVFAKSATFQNIEDIYNFDHEFRHIILHHIETIEVQMKSIYAYEFTKVYGPLGYLDAANFSNQAKHKEIIDKANQQKRQRLAHEAYLKHFINDLHQEIPLWAYVDLLTISDISFLYLVDRERNHYFPPVFHFRTSAQRNNCPSVRAYHESRPGNSGAVYAQYDDHSQSLCTWKPHL